MNGDDYVYQRERHPNSDELADALARWHRAERACMTSSGMAALALAAVARLEQGDRVAVSNQLYGKTQTLWRNELRRFGVEHSIVNPLDMNSVREGLATGAKLLLVETIANPMLRVANIQALADAARAASAEFLVDNTFASPWLFRPMQWGADWVMESVSKMINGHSDVMLGALLGSGKAWDRVGAALTAWGWSAAPLQCWLASRGLATLDVRMERSCQNALELADWLQGQPRVREVIYPGLKSHPDHELARTQFGDRYGVMLTFRLDDGGESFLARCGSAGLPFAPSLGEHQTTLSHPASTSHRGLSDDERAEIGVDSQVIRVSVGVEPLAEIRARFERLLQES